MARHAAWEGELPEQPPHAGRILANIRIDLAVAAFQPSVRQEGEDSVIDGHLNFLGLWCVLANGDRVKKPSCQTATGRGGSATGMWVQTGGAIENDYREKVQKLRFRNSRGTKMDHRDRKPRKGPKTTKQDLANAEQSSERLAAGTKAQPGQELDEGSEEPFARATAVELHPSMSSAEAFRVIAGSCIRQIVANEPGMCAGHSEALHQLRVGLRRLRAAIKAFAEVTPDAQQEAIEGELKWVMKQVGPARDLDVFGGQVLERLDQIGTPDPHLAAAHRSYDELRRQAHETARSSIRSDRFRKILFNLTEWINAGPWTTNAALKDIRERKVNKHAAEIMDEWRKGLRKRCKKLGKLSPKQRHRLRMRAKDLRYVTEFFASLFPAHGKRRAASLAALEKLQDTLGALNDLSARKGIMPKEINLSARARTILSAQEDEAGELLDDAKAVCAKFCDIEAFWK